MVTQAVTFLIYIREVSGWNLGRDTNYPEVVRGLPQLLQANRVQHLKMEHGHFLRQSFQFTAVIPLLTTFRTYVVCAINPLKTKRICFI
jgi:hypothetical protein